MKESYGKGLASHPDPESCGGSRKTVAEALTGAHAGRTLSCEIKEFRVPTLLIEAEGDTDRGAIASLESDPAQSENPGTHGNFLRENRETPQTPTLGFRAGRSEKAVSPTSDMHVGGESDNRIVPAKYPNKDSHLSAEDMEGRRLTKENGIQVDMCRTQGRESMSQGLDGVREVARRRKTERFTALLHHVTKGLLRDSYLALKRKAAPGIDGVTWEQYGIDLEVRLTDLHKRIHQGSYRAQPSKRIYIPKGDGRQRPIGIAVLEDKVVQQAVVTILNHIYEEDFLGFSYGSRPERGAHDALDALATGLERKQVNWVLDADIQGFFDHIDHAWMLKFLEHRIADRRFLRLIQKWLKAGISEDGTWSEVKVGSPQGAVVSPLLANIYLHYVLDLWVHLWRKKQAVGDVIFVRYMDDFVVGFQNRTEAERFREILRERLLKFGLELHPDKTRLIEFGRFAEFNRKQRGEGKPETFDFLGFTHICGKTRKLKLFTVIRKTMSKRLSAKLHNVKMQLRLRMHESIEWLGAWLKSVVQGYFNYHAVPGNFDSLKAFRTQLIRHWFRILQRRSQRHRLNWARFRLIVDLWIPKAKILHPYPSQRFFANHPR